MTRKFSAAIALAVVVTLLPAPAFAWGWAAHRGIMQRAIDLLPPEIRAFFVERRAEVVARAIDPDLWRSAGWEEDHNHFVNFGAPALGAYPFAAYPRDYGEALQKFGDAGLKRLGTLPWREAEMFGNLRRAFEGAGKGNGYASTEVILFSGAASHYLQDATQPLHASDNYNGQLSNQTGVHERFETELYERFEARLTLSPAPPRSIASPRDYAFETLLASHQNVDALLRADKEAIGAKDTYDDAYFESFFTKVRPMLEQRLSSAITATASIIVSAWEQAGRPSLTPRVAREPRKVQRSR
jgi:hypothetical protein